MIKKEFVDNNKPIAIIGSTNSGKSNTAIYLLRQCSHKHKYSLGYPAQLEGITPLSDKDELYKLSDCVVFLDEFQRYFTRQGRHHNDALEEALDFAEHRNIKLILTAQNNQAIDRNLESKIKVWVLKRLNVHTLKNGGMCKVAMNAIKDPRITSAFLALEPHECIWYNIDSEIGENGVYTTPDQNIGKDWKNVPQKVQKKCNEKFKKSAMKSSKKVQ